MLKRHEASFDILSVSALDVFASALGVFMLLALLMFPYWLKQPALRTEVAAAEEAVIEAEGALRAADLVREAANEQRRAAAAELARAQLRLSTAEAELKAADEALAVARAEVQRLPREVAMAKNTNNDLAPTRTNGIDIGALDMVIVIDTTGSMQDEVADVQASLLGIIRVINRLSLSLRVGVVAYRDKADDYVTRVWPLKEIYATESNGVVAFVQSLSVGGGGDEPEAVEEALAVAVAMPWRSNVQGRILIVGDAAARPEGVARALVLARQFRASSGGRRISTIFTGRSPADREFFWQVAEAGGGDSVEYEGAMMESVLMSVLKN